MRCSLFKDEKTKVNRGRRIAASHLHSEESHFPSGDVMERRVSIIGAGGWGTALAVLLAGKGLPVDMWTLEPEVAEEINLHKRNSTYLSEVQLPDGIRAYTSIQEALGENKVVLLVVPSHAMRSVAREVAEFIHQDAYVLHGAKGIEDKTLMSMSEVIKDELPDEFHSRIAVLSGPTHAEEVGRGAPTTAVVAAGSLPFATAMQDLLMCPTFRVYTSIDMVGVELGGSLKNVIALAAGVVDGLGFGDNTKAALITRGLAEISRLGVAMGANPLTFAGLSGLGDLIVTCTSKHSRNRWAGVELGKGRTLDDILSSTKMVVEGVHTARAAYTLAMKHEIEMPITEKVYDVLYNGVEPRDAVSELMTREKTHESDFLF